MASDNVLVGRGQSKSNFSSLCNIFHPVRLLLVISFRNRKKRALTLKITIQIILQLKCNIEGKRDQGGTRITHSASLSLSPSTGLSVQYS